MQIRWSPWAAEDFEAAIHRIVDENATAARRISQVVYDSIGALDKFIVGVLEE